MISEARIASRSAIAIDLGSRGIEGKDSYDLSVLKDLLQVLVDLLILGDLDETFSTPKTLKIDEKAAKCILAALNECEQPIKKELKLEWVAAQVCKVQRGDFSFAKELSMYLARLAGFLLAI